MASGVSPGYVFDLPRILTEQRLFGLAHGITLLADRCFDEPAHGEDVRQAYAAWHKLQETTIIRARDELAHYYFGGRAGEATWSDIVSALGLKNSLPLKSGSARLKAACATLPQALNRSHNDLSAQFDLQEKLDRLTSATVIEAHADACKPMLTADGAIVLGTALEAWRQRYDAALGEARTSVERRWQDAQLEGSFDQWLNQARSRGRHQATVDGCKGLSNWLASPAADPGADFNTRP